MALAEALLRIPDHATAEQLLEDKLKLGQFEQHTLLKTKNTSPLLLAATSWALGLSARIVKPGQCPEDFLSSIGKRLGLTGVKAAAQQGINLLGRHFVLGETIDIALKRAAQNSQYRYSYDMLGEGARTQEDAERYFKAYFSAIQKISSLQKATAECAGISIKLSALHPRFEAMSQERVIKELRPRLMDLILEAKKHHVMMTIDAEEADRLELSLHLIKACYSDDALGDYDGFGLCRTGLSKTSTTCVRFYVSLIYPSQKAIITSSC